METCVGRWAYGMCSIHSSNWYSFHEIIFKFPERAFILVVHMWAICCLVYIIPLTCNLSDAWELARKSEWKLSDYPCEDGVNTWLKHVDWGLVYCVNLWLFHTLHLSMIFMGVYYLLDEVMNLFWWVNNSWCCWCVWFSEINVGTFSLCAWFSWFAWGLAKAKCGGIW